MRIALTSVPSAWLACGGRGIEPPMALFDDDATSSMTTSVATPSSTLVSTATVTTGGVNTTSTATAGTVVGTSTTGFSGTGGFVATSSITGTGTGGAAGAGAAAGAGGVAGSSTSTSTTGIDVPLRDFILVGAPLIFSPTLEGFGINVVTSRGDPALLRLELRDEETGAWNDMSTPATPASDVAQWRVTGLVPGTRYQYRVLAPEGGLDAILFSGSAKTQLPPGSAFRFSVMADSHVAPREVAPGDTDAIDYTEATLADVGRDIDESAPDLIFNLGDILDFHLFGFNDPDGSYTRLGYLNYRRLFGAALGNAAHFPVIGNWDGENGDYSHDQIAYSREQRLLYLPAPGTEPYPEGGSAGEDYYAFTWGDALFVVLNVMSYTTTPHRLGEAPGGVDDWTLGEAQLDFLEQTLKDSTSIWKFLFIHHTVGGAAADEVNSAYGRGGGQAAYVGEQAIVHQLMLDYGARIFFYGHDHVFTDIVVDDIHYCLPGSAGAPWKFDDTTTAYTEYWSQSGHGRVDVSPQSVTVDFIAEGGLPLYGFTLEAP